MKKNTLGFAFIAFVIHLLVACGGGGGGVSGGQDQAVVTPTTSRQPLPVLSQEILPQGARIDLRSSNYFPAQAGDFWIYDYFVDNVKSGQMTRSVTQANGNEFTLSEQWPNFSEQLSYLRTSDGLVAANYLTALNLPTLLEYAEPFYPVGSTRQVIRQGSLGDLNSDGISESFRLEFRQTLVRFETLTLTVGPIADTARFRNVLTLVLQSSNIDDSLTTITSTEEVWLAPGIGIVQMNGSSIDSSDDRADPPYSIRISKGVVNGQQLFLPPIDGTVKKLNLEHNTLVYDAPRQRFLASVPANVSNTGNRIAIIDAVSGQISYSAPVGSQPGALALSPDGRSLVVGLNGTNEVVKLRLSDFAEQWRATLPIEFQFGPGRAETIAISPVDADTVAVSVYWNNVFPRHGGVILIRSGVIQPRQTQGHTGSNLIVFASDGSYLYGFNNESTEYGVRRISVAADGLQQETVVMEFDALSGWTNSIDFLLDGRLLIGRNLYTTPSLAQSQQIGSDATRCRWHSAASRIICRSSTAEGDLTVIVIDPLTLGSLDTAVFARKSNLLFNALPDANQLVPGGNGLVAVRIGPTNVYQPSTGIWLFASAKLR